MNYLTAIKQIVYYIITNTMSITDNTDNNSIITDTESIFSVVPPPPPESKINIGDGQFAYINDKRIRNNLQNGWQAVTITESWRYLNTVKMETFMWSSDPKVYEIGNKMSELGAGHSGASFGSTMRSLEYIAKHGEPSFRNQYSI